MAGDRDVREANVVRVLRGLVVVTCCLGLLATMLDRRYVVIVGAVLVPSGWVYWRPRWGQVVLWAMWTIQFVMLGLMLEIDHLARLATPSAMLLGSITTLIVIVMPLVRRTNRQPVEKRSPNLPQARVVR